MSAYIAIVELPDGEHVLQGWSKDLATARKHIDEYVLNRRRSLIPEEAEQTRLISVREIRPDQREEEIAKEDQRIRDKYPDRLHAGDLFAVPNHILEQRITQDPNEEVEAQ